MRWSLSEILLYYCLSSRVLLVRIHDLVKKEEATTNIVQSLITY